MPRLADHGVHQSPHMDSGGYHHEHERSGWVVHQLIHVECEPGVLESGCVVKPKAKKRREKSREDRDHALWLASLRTEKGRGEAVLAELNKHDWREAE